MENEPALPNDLVAGYGRFRTGRYAVESDRYRTLAEAGQRPRTLVVACSDSRSAPEIVFDAGPGELFVVRNIGALVPAYAPDATAHGVSAALEYGVLALGVVAIVVLGHGRCGAIAAALDAADPLAASDFVGTWTAELRDLARSLELAPDTDATERRLALERRSIERSLDNLRTFPWIRNRQSDGTLRLHGAWFDIGVGELHELGDSGWRALAAS